MRRHPDHELIALARRGSSEAIDVLFDRYWPLVWRAAYAVTADRSLADDAGQEAIAKAFAGLDRFDETRPFGPWAKRIAANCAIDQLRRRKRVELEPSLARWELVSVSEDDSGASAVGDAVAALGEAKRIVVVLRYWLDLPLEEIAGVLGVPVGTVASRLNRALVELRLALEEEHVV